jgi:hypothetical protein
MTRRDPVIEDPVIEENRQQLEQLIRKVWEKVEKDSKDGEYEQLQFFLETKGYNIVKEIESSRQSPAVAYICAYTSRRYSLRTTPFSCSLETVARLLLFASTCQGTQNNHVLGKESLPSVQQQDYPIHCTCCEIKHQTCIIFFARFHYLHSRAQELRHGRFYSANVYSIRGRGND